MVKTELEVKVFGGSNRQARVRLNHKALDKGRELRQLSTLPLGGKLKEKWYHPEIPTMPSFPSLVTRCQV